MSFAETTRFAPSPTGALHLGHAWAACVAHTAARATGGRFLLRIEDIDKARCDARFEAGILADLQWLDLRWDGPVHRQSEHFARYQAALQRLVDRQLLYPCFCTRGDIAREIDRMAAAPQGPDGPLYPGTCRTLSRADRESKLATGAPHALRLDVTRSVALLAGVPLSFEETGRGPGAESGLIDARPEMLGDLVLGRKDLGVSYHLAVVLDDAEQGVTLVTRGEDLFPATHVQRLLQALLALPVPRYQHHSLIRDAQGRRLAKRDRDETLQVLRAAGVTPAQIRQRLGLG